MDNERIREVLARGLEGVRKAILKLDGEGRHRRMLEFYKDTLAQGKREGADPETRETCEGFVSDEQIKLDLAAEELREQLRVIERAQLLLEGKSPKEIRELFDERDRTMARLKRDLEIRLGR